MPGCRGLTTIPKLGSSTGLIPMGSVASGLGHLGRSVRLEAAPGLPLKVSTRTDFLTDSYLLSFVQQDES